MWFLKIIIVIALVCFAALFLGGFLNAEPAEIAEKVLFGGASAVMVLFAIKVIFADTQRKGAKKIMINRTERADEIFWTVILFIITALLYFLAYMLFLDHKPAFGYSMTIFALAGTLGAIFSIKTILVHRFAERAMRKMQKEKEGNR